MKPDGQATAFNAVVRMADKVGAPHYPLPLPVLVRDRAELETLHAQESVRTTFALCARADLTLVGIGQLGPGGPIVVDGFLDPATLSDLLARGAAGEITSWVYDEDGRIMDTDHNRRVASAPLPPTADRPVVAITVGEAKIPALRAALRGRLINGLVTSEANAERLLALP
jgi:DNA-binding transcriptional regulator LsrR (DeoR family)